MSNKQETSAPALKRSWFQGLKSEFSKIVWPSKDSLKRRSVAVFIIAVLLGFLIAGIDWVLQIGLSYLVG